jgi:hypothetical protein
MKDASIFTKLGTNSWLQHVLCNGMFNLTFPVTMATKGHIKIAKYHILRWIFPSKLISKCCNSMNWDTVKGFSALVNCYLLIDLRLITLTGQTSCFAMGAPDPFKLSNRKGTQPLWHPLPPELSFCLGRRRKMWSLFLTTFLQQKHVLGAQTGFYTIWGLKGGVYMR